MEEVMFAGTWRSSSRFSGSRLVLPLFLVAPASCSGETQRPIGSDHASTTQVQESPAAGNAVLHWNAIANQLMVDPGPILDARAFAIFSAAIHDAVNGVERRYAAYTVELSARGASLDAAVAAAAREVLMTFSPSQREKIETAYVAALAAIPDGPARDKGVSVGVRAARGNIERRAADGIVVGPWPPQSGPITQPIYVPTGQPGNYAFTPPFDAPPLGPAALFPGLGRFAPVAVDGTRHRLPGPDALASEAYAADVNRVRSIGGRKSSIRTPDQGATAFFWFEDFPIWNQIAHRVLTQKGVDPWVAARTLALMHFAIADAGIACFEAKYRFAFWRPITAIRRADEDGNAATEADRQWRPLLWTSPEVFPPTFFTPPIPDYPSAAAVVSAAAAAVLTSTFGDGQEFEATSTTLPGVTRRFDSFAQAAEENGMSRVYGGIHFLKAVGDGARLGRGIGREVSELLPPVDR
jgi:hypothetical protein